MFSLFYFWLLQSSWYSLVYFWFFGIIFCAYLQKKDKNSLLEFFDLIGLFMRFGRSR